MWVPSPWAGKFFHGNDMPRLSEKEFSRESCLRSFSAFAYLSALLNVVSSKLGQKPGGVHSAV